MREEEILERLQNAQEDELKDLKVWLFKESIRVRDEKLDIVRQKESFEKEKENLLEENRVYEEHLAQKSKEVHQNEELIARKFDVIKQAFESLDKDRQKLNAREIEIKVKEDRINREFNKRCSMDSGELEDMLFSGVDNVILLKKRYKDLMKIYHPDCPGGDDEMVKAVSKIYERRLEKYESKMKRWRAQ